MPQYAHDILDSPITALLLTLVFGSIALSGKLSAPASQILLFVAWLIICYSCRGLPWAVLAGCGLISSGFCVLLGWYFQPDTTRQNRIIASYEKLIPFIENLRSKEASLEDNANSKKLYQDVIAQSDRVKSSINQFEELFHRRMPEERYLAAENAIENIRAVSENTQSIITQQGSIFIIETSPNNFRVSFDVPMRIPPHIEVTGLPKGSIPHILENSKLGFTIVFTPTSIRVRRFGFGASAEL